ncbi:eukaryotic translation initiation factor 3 subunit D-like [Chenopodium quinoa]|uniref:eukaryotic translation initiation factor 3 subunit D-like n=1 Tax=Chenopodium quinoa TaxID=63459 RepID=UPI000B799AA7|nr:eukaryotic translation initiation factor 3 subunit D-like [Chenopodium quinoa]
MASIYFLGKEPELFVDKCYYKDTYLLVYAGSIPPIQSERHWLVVYMPIDPPPIKIGHNKIKCPNKDNVQPPEPALKRARGRPRKDVAAAPQPTPTSVQSTQATPSSRQQIDTTHHSLTAQPTILGRGGRTIIMGKGSRGGRGRGGAAVNAGRGRGSDVASSSRGASSGNRGV